MSDQTAIVPTQGFFLAPAAQLDTVLQAYQLKKEFIEKVLHENTDFGAIPGAGNKPALLKPGAEKLNTLFGLAPVFEDVVTVEDWTGADHNGEPLFYYRQRCKLYRGDRLIAAADGSCNSRETKYRYRWVGESDIPAGYELTKLKTRGGRISEFAFAIEKAETSGKYGKPAEYWQRFKDAIANGTAAAIKKPIKSGEKRDAWEIDSTLYRIPNDDIPEVVNTILKMAQKRALVAATLIATAASDYFTQDVEDFIDGSWREPEATTGATATTTEAEKPKSQPRQTQKPAGGSFNPVDLLISLGCEDGYHAAALLNKNAPAEVKGDKDKLTAWYLEYKELEIARFNGQTEEG